MMKPLSVGVPIYIGDKKVDMETIVNCCCYVKRSYICGNVFVKYLLIAWCMNYLVLVFRMHMFSLCGFVVFNVI